MKNLKKIVPLTTYRQKWDDNIKIDVESIFVRVRPLTEFICLTQGTNKRKTLLGVVKCAEFIDQLSVYHLVTKDFGPLEAVGHLSKAEENYDDIISEDDAVQTQ